MKARVLHIAILVMLLVGLTSFPKAQSAYAAPPLCYVNGASLPPGDGMSWPTAYTTLQMALANPACLEIWVAQGVYTPDPDPAASFVIGSGVQVYGGFAGMEVVREQRDWVTHLTVLSGDFLNDDIKGPDGITVSTGDILGINSQHVVMLGTPMGIPIFPNTILDGFTITAGQATFQYGGGLVCQGVGIPCNPTLSNLTFIGNYAEWGGGGMYLLGQDGGVSGPIMNNVAFRSNGTLHDGGAIYADGNGLGTAGVVVPQLTNVIFEGNQVLERGGALFGNARWAALFAPMLNNVVFYNNQAPMGGGAIFIDAFHGTSNPILTNATFAGNHADGGKGGAIAVEAQDGGALTVLNNTILWGNTAPIGSQISSDFGTTVLNYSLVEGGEDGISEYPNPFTPGSGSIDADPLFKDMASGNLRLQPSSPAMDAGDNGLVAGGVTTDLDGNLRFMDNQIVADTGNGTAPIVDMGAYEAAYSCPASSQIYVDVNAVGSSELGDSWTSAYTDLKTGLSAAGACAGLNEVWVAEGLYNPGASPITSFKVPPGAQVYGGFSGGETALEQRDPAAHVTILSGDIGRDDLNYDSNLIDETYNDIQGTNNHHVVTMDGRGGTPITSATVMDGFTITGGQATVRNGGGLECEGSGPEGECSPTLSNLNFSGNYAGYDGGGLYANGSQEGSSSPTLTDVTFSGNYAAVGGGISNDGSGIEGESFGGSSSPALTNVTFSGNHAVVNGGAMCNNGQYGGTSSPTLVNVTFVGNSAESAGGAIYDAGDTGTSSPSLTNVTFNGNTAMNWGGAIYNVGYDGASTPTITNTILWGDESPGGAPEISNYWATPTISYSIVQGSMAGGAWDTNLGTDGGGNLDETPRLAMLADNGGPTKTVALLVGSWAIDNADAGSCPSTDQRGVARPQGPTCDIGAYEAEIVSRMCYVDLDATSGANSGESWEDAYLNLNSALASGCTETWVAEGAYTPGPDPLDSFFIQPGIALYGGFSGTELNLEDRDWLDHPTILSGDLYGDDKNAGTTNIDLTPDDIEGTNSITVVRVGSGLVMPTAAQGAISTVIPDVRPVLDGFFITGGNGNEFDRGGGLYCMGGEAEIRAIGPMEPMDCSPILTNLTFSGNQSGYGGAIYADGSGGGLSSPTLSHVTFSGNASINSGGAYFGDGSNLGASNATFTDVVFRGNYAGMFGGALLNDGYAGLSSPSLTRVTFDGNSALVGGAVYNSAGEIGSISSPTFTNVTFSGNSAAIGGGAMFNDGPSGDSSPVLTNVTIVGNSAGEGGGLYNNGMEPTFAVSAPTIIPPTTAQLVNVILWGNTAVTGGSQIYNTGGVEPAIDYSIVQGGDSGSNVGTAFSDGMGNLDADPWLAALHDNGGYTETMMLITGSPAIDAGSPDLCPVDDQNEAPRPVDGNSDATATCDIGAVEYQGRLFADVPVPGKEWMEPWIVEYYNEGITTGCGTEPLIYCPEDSATRAEIAVFLLRAIHGVGYTPPPATNTFSDVPVAGKEWMAPWIDEFYAEGLTTGCAADPLQFCPERHVTRAEMAVFVLRAIHLPGFTPPAAVGIFDDVPVPGKEWMEPWIEHYYDHGITTGCGVEPLIYCPENDTTRAELAVFIGRAFEFYP